MQHGSIVSLLSGTLSPEALVTEIANEVVAFRAELRATKSGRIVVSDGPRFLVTRSGAKLLLEAIATGQLPFDVANYVADCIVMSDAFEFADEATREAIFFIEDDSGRFIAERDTWTPAREEIMRELKLLDSQ